MSTTTSTVRSRHDHPPILEQRPERRVTPAASATRRIAPLDRIALHLGIALIKWGRRPLAVETRERRASRVEQQLARLARERAAERSLRLNVPLR